MGAARIKRRDVTELFSSCCRLVWFKLAHSLFYPKHNPSTFLNAHPSPLCVAERGLMLLTGSGEKQAAGPLLYPAAAAASALVGCLAIYSGLSTQRENGVKKWQKNARNLILSLRRRERHTKGRIFEREREHLRCCALVFFTCGEDETLSLSSALSPPLDLCNYADEVLYTFAYLSLHQTLAFGSRRAGKGKFLCAKSSSRGRQTWWGRKLGEFSSRRCFEST
jgi:hypothetical protein